MRRRVPIAGALALLLAACSLQPVYERPAAPVAASYPSGPAYKPAPGGATLPADEIGWRNFLSDARLQRLVEIAVANNRDLRVARSTVAQSQAQYRILDRSSLSPGERRRERIRGARAGGPPSDGTSRATSIRSAGHFPRGSSTSSAGCEA
jgi:multidrug efflux system outer membrane protein